MNTGAFFDWYECTLVGVFDPAPVVHMLGGSLNNVARGHQNYPASYAWELPNGGSVQVWFGSDLEVHVVLTSAACDSLVRVVKDNFVHGLSRGDVAFDYDYPGAFNEMWPLFHALAKGFKPRPVKVDTRGDWISYTNGRTLSLGSRQSVLYTRFYEKGKEQAAKHPDQTFSEDWVRMELEVKPSKSADKLAAALLDPVALACSTKFGSDLVLLLLGHADASPLPTRVPSTDPLYWMLRQYGPALSKLLLEEPNLSVAELLERRDAPSAVFS